ncbi:MAG: 50S ribosomal protein L17 [Armatimonadetes bacterium Cent15-Ar3]|jgi:large subunit ribosomal protein L17|nr:MAG: 50S ribosomal protein L17 [Armatimonadetes bacterium Cent15-Ar3]
MRHKVDHRKLGLPTDQRLHLLTNLSRQFVTHGYVRTTFGRAKEVQRMVEKLITLTKLEDGLEARRRARKILVGHSSSNLVSAKMIAGKTELEVTQIKAQFNKLNGEDLVKHLFDNIGPRYKDRNGGYTRVVKTGNRRGDGAQTAVIELV